VRIGATCALVRSPPVEPGGGRSKLRTLAFFHYEIQTLEHLFGDPHNRSFHTDDTYQGTRPEWKVYCAARSARRRAGAIADVCLAERKFPPVRGTAGGHTELDAGVSLLSRGWVEVCGGVLGDAGGTGIAPPTAMRSTPAVMLRLASGRSALMERETGDFALIGVGSIASDTSRGRRGLAGTSGRGGGVTTGGIGGTGLVG
jgi:hypothetical protein